jgi:hypothetical protein
MLLLSSLVCYIFHSLTDVRGSCVPNARSIEPPCECLDGFTGVDCGIRLSFIVSLPDFAACQAGDLESLGCLVQFRVVRCLQSFNIHNMPCALQSNITGLLVCNFGHDLDFFRQITGSPNFVAIPKRALDRFESAIALFLHFRFIS